MSRLDDTQRCRLERAFETLRKNEITPLLILSGSTGVIAENLADYRELAAAAGTPSHWVGAHVGAREHYGAYWDSDTGKLLFRHDDSPVLEIWWSYPLYRENVAKLLLDALCAEGFQASWLNYDDNGQVLGPGTQADCVRLVLKEN